MKYHDYIWDLGGTLLDNYELSAQAFLETLLEFGITANHDIVYKKLKDSTASAITFFIPNEPNFLKLYKEKEASHLSKPILFNGAREVLSKICDEGSRNFLISHRDNHVLEILRKTQIEDYFTEIVTSESHFKRKPDPESMLYLKRKYNIESCLVIGDRTIDQIAGQFAGFDTLLVEGDKSLLEVVR